MTRPLTVEEIMLRRRGKLTETFSCSGKKSYDRREAERVAEIRGKATGEKLHAYSCLYCDSWHIGHPLK